MACKHNLSICVICGKEVNNEELKEKIRNLNDKIEEIFNYVEIKRKKDKRIAPDDLEYWIGRTKELIIKELNSLLSEKEKCIDVSMKCVNTESKGGQKASSENNNERK